MRPDVARADAIVVFNEVMYHPAVNEPALEWVELYNQNAVDVDLSGWRLANAIDYTFPNGTIIRGGGYLVVALDPSTLMAGTGLTNVMGPFTGRLSNSGEAIHLRDLNQRLMDVVSYGVEGDWPVGADGGGPSLAKRQPNLSSGVTANWTVSREMGGSPGAANFPATPLTGGRTNVVGVTSYWRYQDLGLDLGSTWKDTGFDDSDWGVGAGLFYDDDSPLPAPKTTPLASGRDTYYFRTTFDLPGDPAAKLISLRPIVDDGAVFYLNGTEALRFNMPTGAVSYTTRAASVVSHAAFAGPFSIAAANLVPGRNVIAAEVHQTTASTNAGLRTVAAAGYAIAWDGREADYSTPASPALAPTNAALAAAGVNIFTSSNTNQAYNLIDGQYGNAHGWSPATNDLGPLVVLRFNQTIPISSIAWGRDNGDATESACGGTCTDRALGNYTLQYTLVPDPATVIANASNPSNGWSTLATVQYLSAQPGFSPYLRHRFTVQTTTGNPIFATGLRFRPSTTNTIDEIEINPPTPPSGDAAFGLEVAITDILPPPPRVRFNEVAAGTNAGFWLEIINADDHPVDLAGVQLVRSSNLGASFVFPAQSLAPGGIVALTQEQLGFSAAEQTVLYLYAAGRSLLLDSVRVRAKLSGRSPDGAGDWSYPAVPTPGASNIFIFHDEIVINELMYHDAPRDPVPPLTSNMTAIALTGVWRYNDTGADLGAGWSAPGYDDSHWASGAGLASFNTGALPIPVQTTLAQGRTTYYFRTTFPFSGGTSNLTLNLRSIVDDGAVFYLNGVEILRQNMPAGLVSYGTSAASAVGDAAYFGPVTLSASNLVEGMNVVAVEVHQVTPAVGSTGIVLTGGGLTLVEEGPVGGAVPMNLARQLGAAPFVIDSLAGYPIHDFSHLDDGVYGNQNSWIGNSGSPGYAGIRFGGSFTINSIAFGRDNTAVYNDRTLGTYTLQYTRVATPGTATTVTGNADTGWATVGTLNYQSAGSGLFASPSRRHRFNFDSVQATGIRLVVPGTGISVGTCIDELEVNPPDTSGDIAFAAELVLTTTLVPALPFTKSDEQWVELYNRSSSAVDLTDWLLDGAVHYHFVAGASIPPGGYLVVANHAAALQAKWPDVASSIVGDLTGKMSDGERVRLEDPAGNVANAVRLRARGWSDGGGSSLELTDARSDNNNPDVWADSEEGSRSVWLSVTYRMIAGQRFGNVFWNEFRLGLLDSAEILVDDVSVVSAPDGARQQLIQNGDFESTTGNTHWRMLGDHGASQIIPEPGNSANHVLKVVATSPARTSHNHIESSFLNNTALVDGAEYEVSFRARWLHGSPQVDTTGYFQKLARTTILPVPSRHGTPGAPNSQRVANAGPTMLGLQHTPIIPQASNAVVVSVRVTDPDGVGSVTLNYRINPSTLFSNAPMALQPDGTWTATVPAQAAGKIVQFYVSAQDTLGAIAMAPPAGPGSRALYQVADAQGSKLPAHELRLIQLDADRDFLLNATNVMSQQHLGATLIYDRSEVFYDAGVRLHGSAASRARDGDDYISYDIEFPPDHLFRGIQGGVGVDRSGRSPTVRQQDEIYILHMFHRAGLPCHYSDLCYFIAPKTLHTGTAILQLGAYNGVFVNEQYESDGAIFNFDLTYEPSTTVGGTFESIKLPVPLLAQIPTDFADLGNDREQYRAPFDIRYGERADNFAGIMRLCQTMGSPQPLFDAQIAAALDVDEALRLTALTILCGIGDIYFNANPSNPHNCRIFTPSKGGPAQFLPWDMDFVFYHNAADPIFPTTSYNISKFMNNPATRRLYLSHVNDLCQTVFNTTYMTPWLAHYGSVVGQTFTGQATYIQNRRNAALGQLPAQVPFAITSNGGNDFSAGTNFVTLSGTGWIDVRGLEVNGIPYTVNWTTITNWSVTVPLGAGTNLLTVQAVDPAGQRPSNRVDTITVTNLVPPARLPVVINEWMAHNVGPGGFADPLDGLYQDWFELFNPNTTAVDLGGYYLTDDFAKPTKFAIPTNTTIAARGFLLVWADSNGSQNAPTNADLHASFKLNEGGDSLGLFGPDGISPQHTVTFGTQFQNVSEGLFPDGAVGFVHRMTNWTPRASNQLGLPPAPGIVSISSAPGLLQLSVSVAPMRSYQVEYKDSLDAPDWTPIGAVMTAATGTLVFEVPMGPEPQRFFRIQLQ